MSTLAVAILSGIIGALIGVILGRVIDPMHQEHQQQTATLKKTQQDLEDLRSQIKEHFTHTSGTLLQLSESARNLHTQLAHDAMKISGLDLHPAENKQTEEYHLSRLLSGQATEAPRDYAPKDYAPKTEYGGGTLSEEYGLKDDDYSPKSARS